MAFKKNYSFGYMKRYFYPILVSLLITLTVSAHGGNLWEHFQGNLPSLKDRGAIFNENISTESTGSYTGSAPQNEELLSFLHAKKLGSFSFPPSSVEGPTTAGWTDDGSVVRLNTASDSVGIGTTNPIEKLTVQSGNAFIGGTLAITGGTFIFGSNSGTSTLYVSNSGKLGIGSTTPTSTFSVQGNVFGSATGTFAVLESASSTIKVGSQILNFIGTNVASGTSLQTDGKGNLSFNTSATLPSTSGAASSSVLTIDGSGTQYWLNLGWTLLVATSTPIATTTLRTGTFPAMINLKIIVDIPTDTNGVDLAFNDDGIGNSGTNYGMRMICNGTNNVDGSCGNINFSKKAIFLPGNTSASSTYSILQVNNIASKVKAGNSQISIYNPTTLSSMGSIGTFIWNNTSNQITSVGIFDDTLGGTLGAGTAIRVWGSNTGI